VKTVRSNFGRRSNRFRSSLGKDIGGESGWTWMLLKKRISLRLF
jgi:hypothetical protein